MVPIDRKTSIETEPMTLRFDQIQYAREAALYVVNTRTAEEALHIFTEGLEPMVSAVNIYDEGEDVEDATAHSLLSLGLRDIASAPF